MLEDLSQLADDPEQLFAEVGRRLVEARDFHSLFDLRILQRRYELGLPVELFAPLAEQDSQQTAKLEKAYLEACREVGQLFLEANRPLEAWRYLRPTGEKEAIRDWLARTLPEDHNADQLIELALHERIDPERGYAWLLARRGTCQGVSELEMLQPHLSLQDQRACAAVLLRHLHHELQTNLRSFLWQLNQPFDEAGSLSQWLDTHQQQLRNQTPLVDASHLAAAVRFARALTDPALLDLAVDLACYGMQLAEDYIYPEPEPFEEVYKSHHLMFRATQGHDVAEALEYFGNRARKASAESSETTAVEVYLALLHRSGRAGQALAEYADLVSEERVLTDFAPSLLELARADGNWQKYFELCQSRNDIISFAAGKLAQHGLE